jgi:hypothetical protein
MKKTDQKDEERLDGKEQSPSVKQAAKMMKPT